MKNREKKYRVIENNLKKQYKYLYHIKDNIQKQKTKNKTEITNPQSPVITCKIINKIKLKKLIKIINKPMGLIIK